MAKYVVKKNENAFREWLRSITFVKRDGTLLHPKLVEDESPDPEGDREQKS